MVTPEYLSGCSMPYLWLSLYAGGRDAGGRDVVDLDERLRLVIVVILHLRFILIGDDHHWLHVFRQ